MAGISNSEEQDYWPGYVDALTAMVKVLTFVMMIMAVAMFAMMQQASKSSIERIAEAANIKVEHGQVDRMVEQLVTALKLSVQPVEVKPEAVAELPVAAPAPVLPQVTAQERIAVAAPERPVEQTPVSIGPAPEDALTLQFERGAVSLDEASKAALKTFADGHGLNPNADFTIKATVDVASGALSEERRSAFYRAMMVRQTLTAAGITKERIVVRVVDGKAGEAQLVKVFAQGGAE